MTIIPPPLDADVLAALPAPWQVEILGITGSTNLVAKERALVGADEGRIIVAEHQTRGRGRFDRRWMAPSGTALTFTMLLRPGLHGVPVERIPSLALTTGIAVVRALGDLGLRTGLKWPNDVLVSNDGREFKMCGMLAESVPGTDAVVVGVGLNVHQAPDELPTLTSTSLHLQGVEADRTAVLVAFLDRMAVAYADWCADADWLLSAYTEISATLGREVSVELPGASQVRGVASGIDETGRLVLSTADGPRVVSAGEVVHARH